MRQRAIDGFTEGSAEADMLAAHEQMLAELQGALGHAPLIANHAYNLSHVNAAQIEAGGPDAISLDALRWSAENNKLVQFHIEYGYPGTVPDFANSYQACHNATMFTNALATFLIGAGEHAYFGCFPWHSDIQWPEFKQAVWHAEYEQPLGEPRGPAVLDGTVWRREFASGTVVTLDTRSPIYTGQIHWADGGRAQPIKSDDAPSAAPATFSSLTLVGERWDNGVWGPLNAEGHSDPATRTLKRGDPGAQLITSPQQSPDLLRLSATTVLCTANDTVFASTDAGRSWEVLPYGSVGRGAQLGSGYIPSPAWLRQNESSTMQPLWMSVQPVDAYVKGCYPRGGNCSAATSVTADPAKQYFDWGLSKSGGLPQALKTVGRRSPNVWHGLPAGVTEFCTSCGSGTQLADGSFIYLVVVQFGPVGGPCCNNSVVAFTSTDGLDWKYSSTAGPYDERRLWQEGPNECDVVLLKDKKTL